MGKKRGREGSSCMDPFSDGLGLAFHGLNYPQDTMLLASLFPLCQLSALQYVPYIRTFKLWTFKDVNVHSHVQSRKLVHMSGGLCHMCASSTSSCAFVYFTVQYCIEYSSTVSLFQAQDVWKQALKQRWCSWYYCTFQVSTVRLKMFSLFFVLVCFLCIICVKSFINLFQCSTI